MGLDMAKIHDGAFLNILALLKGPLKWTALARQKSHELEVRRSQILNQLFTTKPSLAMSIAYYDKERASGVPDSIQFRKNPDLKGLLMKLDRVVNRVIARELPEPEAKMLELMNLKEPELAAIVSSTLSGKLNLQNMLPQEGARRSRWIRMLEQNFRSPFVDLAKTFSREQYRLHRNTESALPKISSGFYVCPFHKSVAAVTRPASDPLEAIGNRLFQRDIGGFARLIPQSSDPGGRLGPSAEIRRGHAR